MVGLAKAQHAAMQKLVGGLNVTAEKIRTLDRARYKRSEIAKFLGVRYQHVRNVLVREEEKAKREEQASAVEPRLRRWSLVGPDGRVEIPAEYRRVLGVGPGEHVLMMLEDGEVRLVGRRAAVRRARELVARYIPKGTRLSDELIADRRAEAAREEQA